MAELSVLFIHSLMFHVRSWRQAADLLEEHGISLLLADQSQGVATLSRECPDILVAELTAGGADFSRVIDSAADVGHRLGLSAEFSEGFTTFDETTAAEFVSYTEKLSPVNYASAILLLAKRAGFEVELPEKQVVQSSGIYHPEADGFFVDTEDYFAWQHNRNISPARKAAIIFYYAQLVEGGVGEIDSLITRCERRGICPVPVFSAGVEGDPDPDWLPHLMSIDGLGAVVSFMAGRLLRHREEIHLLEELNVPILQTMRSYSQTPDEWFEDPQGVPAMSAVFSQTYPEMFGCVRPTMVAGVKLQPESIAATWMREYQPVDERIETLVERLSSQFVLREKPARQKRLTIVLHNNPCKGVEATIGMAVGLDSFTSLGLLLERLAESGYDIGDCPTDGKKLLDEFLERKAIAEFRWTTIDEIVSKGGGIYMMDGDEYHQWFDAQHEKVRARITEDWGAFPGEGMAWNHEGKDVLLITGLKYGNIHIINQPKRGCYGAKCTGEVCRILHDPQLSPPHHWFATYKYIRDNSDAVIHFGTEGALEYLPGKQNGLSGCCFPEVSLGALPNFYIYVMDAIGEGMVAKRRGQATLVDHLGPVFSPAAFDDDMLRLESLLDQHSAAGNSGDRARLQALEKEIGKLSRGMQTIEEGSEERFDIQVDLLRRRLAAVQKRLSPEGLHTLGQPPSFEARGRLLATMLRRTPAGIETTDELGAQLEGEAAAYTKVSELLTKIVSNQQVAAKISPAVRSYCLEVNSRLQKTGQEIDNLLAAIAGGYVVPGPAGSLVGGRIEPLPSGRNFYSKDVSLLPTRAAHNVGRKMADELLRKYLGEEGSFPERVGISIWSSDAFKSDGEQFCQILTLMGVRPHWDRQDKVDRLEVVPLDDLRLDFNDKILHRPRVDVTIETSGIMRDMVPHFCELLDEAVVLVSSLDEPHERNFVKKHTDETMADLSSRTDTALSEKEMRRMATFRVFSSAPGTYGLGVGLALDASAWTSDRELAEIYINWGGQAYGAGNVTTVARDMLARQLSGLDVAYMRQASEEYDILDCSCYAVSQGSMAAATRVLGHRDAKLYWTEAGNDRELSDVAEQLQRSAAARLLNKRWIEAMKEHGYQGAMAVSGRVNNLFKWSATTHEVSKDLFDRVVSTYILDQHNRTWLMESNPYAMEEITRRLLEAASRDLWEADEDMLQAVQAMALDIEGDMEEIMGEVSDEFQGGKVEVLGVDKVEKWQHEWRIGDD